MYTSASDTRPSTRCQIALLIIMALLLLPWLGTTWFNSKGEPREAIVAVSILQSGNWILPVNYGADIPFKPPFLGWLIAVFAKIFNGGEVNEYISRLPSALACMAMVWAGYRWSARLRGDNFAMIMALVTVTSVEVLRAAVACRLDMVLTAAMLIAMYQLFTLQRRKCRHRGLRYAFVILMLTAATLTKGPVGALLPCLVIGVYWLLRGERFVPTLLRLSGICLASFVLPALWFWAAMRQGGDSFVNLMYEENIGRLLGTMSYESHVKPFWYNFVTILAGMAPWTLLGVLALFDARRFRRATLRPAGLFCLVTFVLVLLFYCIPSSKRSVYLLPLYPAMAYGVACMLNGLRQSRVLNTYVWILAVAAVLAPVALTLALSGITAPAGLRLWGLDWWMWPVLYLPLAAGVLWMFTRRDSIAFAVGLPVVLFMAYLAAVQPAVLKPNSDRQYVGLLEDAPAVYSLGERYYTLNYYLKDRIRLLPDSSDTAALIPGTVILYGDGADISRLGAGYEFQRITDRASDYRGGLNMAIKSK